MKVLLAAVALAAVVLVARPAPAGAHAVFITSNPAPDSVIYEYTDHIRIVFSQTISRESWLVLTAPDGTVVSGEVSVSENVMTAPIWWGGWGTYRVDWYNISLEDGHEVTGSFTFTVA
jgi:methionine-rich copper-binding protein CopC